MQVCVDFEQATGHPDVAKTAAYVAHLRQWVQAVDSWNLGVQYARQGNLERAIALMQACVDIQRAMGHADAEYSAAQVEQLRQVLEAAE